MIRHLFHINFVQVYSVVVELTLRLQMFSNPLVQYRKDLQTIAETKKSLSYPNFFTFCIVITVPSIVVHFTFVLSVLLIVSGVKI